MASKPSPQGNQDMKFSTLLAVAGLVAATTSVHAVTIPGLNNTGTSTSFSVDPNYRFSVTSGTATGTACGAFLCGVTTADGAFPLTVWASNITSAASKWITPSANAAQNYDPVSNGIYVFTETFDLTGYLPGTASFSGRFMADNSATIQLNGGPVLATSNSFTSWTTFSAASGFIAGINTVTFTLTNQATPAGNPTGLRVEFTASDVTAVPEPSALLLSLAGLAMVGGLAKRRLASRA
jgi:hypothetical protein